MRFSFMSSFVLHRYEVDVGPKRSGGFIDWITRTRDFVARRSEHDPACVSRIEILIPLEKWPPVKGEILDADIRDPMDILRIFIPRIDCPANGNSRGVAPLHHEDILHGNIGHGAQARSFLNVRPSGGIFVREFQEGIRPIAPSHIRVFYRDILITDPFDIRVVGVVNREDGFVVIMDDRDVLEGDVFHDFAYRFVTNFHGLGKIGP